MTLRFEYRPDLCPHDHYAPGKVFCFGCGTDCTKAKELRKDHDREDKLRDIAANGR